MIRAFGLGSNASNYEDALKEVREWLDKQQGVNSSSIKVENNKTTVTLPDGRFGVSRCNPCDKFDIITGIRVALDDIERKSKKLSEKERMLLSTAILIGGTHMSVVDGDIVVWDEDDYQIICCDRNGMFDFLQPCEEYSITQLLSERG